MALIKSATSNRLLKEAIVLDLGDLGRQGQRLLDAAREQANKLLQDAQQTAERIIADASGRGHAEGFERGRAEGIEQGRREGREQSIVEHRAQLEALHQKWIEALNKWESERRRMFDDAREDVLRFALKLASKIVHKAIHVDSSIISAQLIDALRIVSGSRAVEIVIHPDDRKLVDELLPQIQATVQSCEHVSIREEVNVTRGGCMVMTGSGYVDAQIETQLSRIAENILGESATGRSEAGDEAQSGEERQP